MPVSPMRYQGKLQFASATDKGMIRPNNEDAIITDLDTGMVVAADGMGGYKAGEIASGMAVEIIQKFVANGLKHSQKLVGVSDSGYSRESTLLRNAITHANEAIHDAAKSQAHCEGMGTTVAAALFYNNRVSIAHVGDSRVYRLRRGHMDQITKDHSLLQELVTRGFYTSEDARRSLNRNLVTRALGIEPVVQVDIQEDVVLRGDIYLLSTDGLHDMVPDPDIHLTVDTFSDNLETAAMQLVKLANDNGGRDNVSVILAKSIASFEIEQKKGVFRWIIDRLA